jgi:hypothetical protein
VVIRFPHFKDTTPLEFSQIFLHFFSKKNPLIS